MKKTIWGLIAVLVFIAAPWASLADECKTVYGRGDHQFRLATGSAGELGLLEKLADAFLPDHQASMCWKKADEIKGYFMTDSSTWVAGKRDLTDLKILFRGDPVLVNTYHGLCQPKAATSKWELAAQFIDFLGSEKGQNIIRNFGRDLYGESMYNDAAYAEKHDK